MGIFDKGWKNKNKEKALEWISKHKGTSLIDALFSEDKVIREATVNQLIQQDINTLGPQIYSFYDKCDKNTKSRFIKELNDQTIISGLIKIEKDYSLITELVSRITDQKLLRDLASHSLEQAVEVIDDKNTIYDMLTNENFYVDDSLLSDYRKDYCRKRKEPIKGLFASKVFEKFHDNSRLLDVLTHTPYEEIYFSCLQKMKNEEKMNIMDIVFNKQYSNIIRREAINFIDDESMLCKIADSDEEYDIQLKAVENMKTPKIRKKYCEKFGTHKWKEVDVQHHDAGDRDYLTRIYECEFCGDKKSEEDTYVY